MKKIIATVLAMVMALALCTTAFAAPKTAFSVGQDLPTYDSNYSYELKAAAAAYEGHVGTYQVYKTDLTTKAVTPETTVYVKVALANQADAVLVVGTDVTYLADATNNTAYDKKATAAKTVDTVKNCGDVKALGTATLYDVDGDLFVATTNNSTKTLLVGDLLVKAAPATPGTDYETKTHSYKADTTASGTDVTVTKVYCTNDGCNKSFNFVVGTATDAAKKFGLGGYEQITAVGYTAPTGKALFIQIGSGATNTTTNTTTSPKTFDAGIAMYVGMALTSVAGSAVVIGKKKEF